MKTLVLLALLLPGCSALGIPTPWPNAEEVAYGDADTLAKADAAAAERVDALEKAVEASVGVEVAHDPAEGIASPDPVSGAPGGVGLTELLIGLAVVFFGRGIPSKGPIPALVHGVATAFKPRKKASTSAPPA